MCTKKVIIYHYSCCRKVADKTYKCQDVENGRPCKELIEDHSDNFESQKMQCGDCFKKKFKPIPGGGVFNVMEMEEDDGNGSDARTITPRSAAREERLENEWLDGYGGEAAAERGDGEEKERRGWEDEGVDLSGYEADAENGDEEEKEKEVWEDEWVGGSGGEVAAESGDGEEKEKEGEKGKGEGKGKGKSKS